MDREHDVVVTNERGLKIIVDPDDPRGTALREAGGTPNPHSTRLWELTLGDEPWDLVVDVGANYGEMLASADLSQASRIVAFEPSARIADKLAETIEGLPWRVELFRTAVAAHVSTGEPLVVDRDWSGSSTLKSSASITMKGHGTEVETVPVTTIDEFVGASVPSRVCMKIDVEGAELDVLAGAVETLANAVDVRVMIEILHMPVEEIALLARLHPMFVLDPVDDRLVRIFGKDRNALGRQLHSGRVSRQDAILLAGTGVVAAEQALRGAQPPAKPRRAVYTALIGDYETLQEQPLARDSEVPFICLTDDPSLTSETWDVRLIEPAFPLDSIRSARSLKIVGHELVDGYDETIWVDNRVLIDADPDAIFDALLEECDFAAIEHSFREAVIDEFEAVVTGGYDDPHRIYEQLMHYSEHSPAVLDEKPIWTGFLVRRSTEAVQEAMRTWLDHVLRYSRRDQLSVLVALRSSEARCNFHSYDNRSSPWHRWPPISAALGRRSKGGHRFEGSVRAPLTRLRAATVKSEEILLAHEKSATLRDEQIKKLQAELARHQAELPRLEAQLAKQRERSATLEQKLRASQKRAAVSARQLKAIKNSRSFKLARRLAATRSALGRSRR